MSLPCESRKVQSSRRRRVTGNERDDGGRRPARPVPRSSRPRDPSPAMPPPPATRRRRCWPDSLMPAVFPVILVFTPNEAARGGSARVGLAARPRRRCTAQHDIVLHRPLVLGEPLQTWSQISAVRTTPGGHTGRDAVRTGRRRRGSRRRTVVDDGAARTCTVSRTSATTPAEHRFPDDARTRPIGSVSHHIEADIAHRYAEVSGDWSAHHFDIEVARAAGFDFVFAHGLCTMAICTHRVLGLLGVDDPGLVRRVAVRFTSPTPLDCDLTVNAYVINQHSFAFEAVANGTTTITHGRLELRS